MCACVCVCDTAKGLMLKALPLTAADASAGNKQPPFGFDVKTLRISLYPQANT